MGGTGVMPEGIGVISHHSNYTASVILRAILAGR